MGLNRAQDTVIIVSSVFPALAIIAMLLRIRARSITSKRLQADDYWLVVATAVTVAGSVLYIVGAAVACIGVHLDQCSPERLLLWGKIAYMIQFFYIVSVSCVKISVLLFYKRTFHSLSRYFIHCVYATLTITVLWTITFSIATLLQEWPIAAFWDKSIPSRWKIDSTQMYIWLAITDILLDVVTLGLPIRMILKLRMSSRNKWALAGVFTIGSIAVIAGAVRLVYARQFHRNHFDVTYAMHHLAIWSSIEPSVGIISACLPLLHPFFKRHAPEAIVDANSAIYGLMRAKPDGVYHNPRGVSISLDKVDQYHENVIE